MSFENDIKDFTFFDLMSPPMGTILLPYVTHIW
jgi:hypothetical protein